MMHLDKNTHVYSIYFFDGDGCDVLFTIYRRGDGPREMYYRFRYDECDEHEEYRSAYHLKEDPGKELSLEQAMAILTSAAPRFGFGEPDIVECDCNGEEAIAKMLARPWCNIVSVDGADQVVSSDGWGSDLVN